MSGRIICPDGSIIVINKVKGSIPYAWLVRDIIGEKHTEDHKDKLLNIILETGVFDKNLINYLYKLIGITDNKFLRFTASKALDVFNRKKNSSCFVK